MDLYLLIVIILSCLSLVYGIFMIMYLSDAKKCDKYLSERNENFRKAALVITWINVILNSILLLFMIIGEFTHLKPCFNNDEYMSSSRRVANPATIENIVTETIPTRRVFRNSRDEIMTY